MDILSWNLKVKFEGVPIEDTITGFPTKESAEKYINTLYFSRVKQSWRIVPDYWEPSYRTYDGKLDIGWDI